MKRVRTIYARDPVPTDNAELHRMGWTHVVRCYRGERLVLEVGLEGQSFFDLEMQISEKLQAEGHYTSVHGYELKS